MKHNYNFYAMLTVTIWSIGNVYTRVVIQELSPNSIGFLRYFVATFCLLSLIVIKKVKLPTLKDLYLFAFSGCTGFFLYMITFNKGFSLVSASIGSVVSATIPLITASLAQMIFKERLNLKQWLCLFLQFGGIVVIAMGSSSISASYGIFYVFLSAISMSVYNLLQRKLSFSYDALQISVYSMLFGSVMLCIFAPTAFCEISKASSNAIFAIVFLGVFASFISFLCWTKALSLAQKASQVSNYLFFTPVLTTLFEILILRVLPSVFVFAGGAVILIGAFLFSRVSQQKTL